MRISSAPVVIMFMTMAFVQRKLPFLRNCGWFAQQIVPALATKATKRDGKIYLSIIFKVFISHCLEIKAETQFSY